jgi:hypothetical protein
VTQFDRDQSIQKTIDMIQSIFPVTETSLPTRQGDTQYQSVVIEIKDPTFIAMSGIGSDVDQTWDHYPFIPTYSSSQSFTSGVTFNDLINDPDKGFVSGFVASSWLRAELSQIEDVNRVTVSAGNLPGFGNTAALLNGAQIQTSIDGIQWTHVQTISGVTDTNGKNVFTLPQTNYCRFLRLFQPSGSGLAVVGLWINA